MKQTREEWLWKVAEELRPEFKAQGFPLPTKLRLGCGWPSSRAFSQTKRRLGECWHPKAARDGSANIVVSLYLDKSMVVAGTLIHELCHAATPEAGHKGKFVTCIKMIGLLGKPVEAHKPTTKLKERLQKLFKRIGKYPHGSVDANLQRKKQGTRMIKLQCEGCGYVVRTTQKWIEAGTPLCFCSLEPFQVAL